MPSGKSVFLVGPGFIGWNVLELLAEDYRVTGYVRRQEHGEQIKASGASAIVYGDLNDTETITKHSAEHDITLHTATADHLPSVLAILDGIRIRANKGLPTTFIHTSGASVLDDYPINKGNIKTDVVYLDTDRAAIDAVPDNAPHRQIDLAIVSAQKELGDRAKLAIMTPPLVYGFNPNHGRLSIQIPTLTRFALKHGYAPYIGEGEAVASNIHVLDLTRAYLVLLRHLESSEAREVLKNPYYFCEGSGDAEPSWREVAAVIGDHLHRAGRIPHREPRKVEDEEELGDLFGPWNGAVLGLNSRSRAVRLQQLGWQAREKDWKTSYIEDELPKLLQEETGAFEGYKVSVSS